MVAHTRLETVSKTWSAEACKSRRARPRSPYPAARAARRRPPSSETRSIPLSLSTVCPQRGRRNCFVPENGPKSAAETNTAQLTRRSLVQCDLALAGGRGRPRARCSPADSTAGHYRCCCTDASRGSTSTLESFHLTCQPLRSTTTAACCLRRVRIRMAPEDRERGCVLAALVCVSPTPRVPGPRRPAPRTAWRTDELIPRAFFAFFFSFLKLSSFDGPRRPETELQLQGSSFNFESILFPKKIESILPKERAYEPATCN